MAMGWCATCGARVTSLVKRVGSLRKKETVTTWHHLEDPGGPKHDVSKGREPSSHATWRALDRKRSEWGLGPRIGSE